MKTVLLLGAGKSATVLIEYLKKQVQKGLFSLVVADKQYELALEKTGNSQGTIAISLDIDNAKLRQLEIQKASVVISMLPPHLHIKVAMDCIAFKKHLLTASYMNEEIRQYNQEIQENGLLFLYEMGLDPGIDHMSAMQLIDSIKSKGGEINSFKSHCGGLVAPASDNNPWHYKISWNPRNVVTAGKDGAIYKMEGKIIKETQEKLFSETRTIQVVPLGELAYYPNRDSLNYLELYKLSTASSFVRTTLRHPDFMAGWKEVINWGLTNDTPTFKANHLTLAACWKQILHSVDFDTLNTLTKNQLVSLGYDDQTTLFPMSEYTPASFLQWCLETKLKLGLEDRDMVVMVHEIEYTTNQGRYRTICQLIKEGANNVQTAMAQTVGLPLGIACTLLIEEKIKTTGLIAPILKEIYEPVLSKLKEEGIYFSESTSRI